jgi:signal transduction histidine kinase
LLVIIVLLSFIFALRVLSADANNKANKAFAVFTITTALWLIIDYSLYQSVLSDFQTFLNRLDLAVICLMILSLAYFVSVFPREIFKIPKYIYVLSIIVTVAVVYIILFTNTVVHDAFMEDYGSNFNQGSLFLLFAAYATIFAIYSIIVLIIKYIKLEGEEKKQIKYIFYGISILVFFNLLFNLFIPIFTKNFALSRFGSYSSISFVIFTAYAILKAKLFNIKVILTESAVVILNVISVVQIFTSSTLTEGLLRTLFALIIFYGSYILLKSVRLEIKQKEELQVLTTELAQANGHLKELDQMKTEFVSLASHELLTPVSAIEGYLSMMLDEHLAKVEDPTAKKYLDRIYRSSRRLARLIADMLNISRIEEGRLLIEKKDTDLSELVKQVIDEIKFKADEKKQKVIFDNLDKQINSESDNQKENRSSDQPIIQSSDLKSYCDPDKIKEVVVNLVGNSIKYSKDPGEIHIIIKKVPLEMVQSTWQRIENDVKSRPLDDQEAIKSSVDPHYRELVGQDQLLIAVKDQGIGIPVEELPRLFKKFHRVGDYTTAESQGTGLGLYISRSLVELNHGRIWADSEGHGHGSTFSFTLPEISSKEAIIEMEKDVDQNKEQLKPLAKSMNSKPGEDL